MRTENTAAARQREADARAAVADIEAQAEQLDAKLAKTRAEIERIDAIPHHGGREQLALHNLNRDLRFIGQAREKIAAPLADARAKLAEAERSADAAELAEIESKLRAWSERTRAAVESAIAALRPQLAEGNALHSSAERLATKLGQTVYSLRARLDAADDFGRVPAAASVDGVLAALATAVHAQREQDRREQLDREAAERRAAEDAKDAAERAAFFALPRAEQLRRFDELGARCLAASPLGKPSDPTREARRLAVMHPENPFGPGVSPYPDADRFVASEAVPVADGPDDYDPFDAA